MHHYLEPLEDSKWPRRLTVVGYLVVAMIVILILIRGVQLW
jgi:hypothetical protein